MVSGFPFVEKSVHCKKGLSKAITMYIPYTNSNILRRISFRQPLYEPQYNYVQSYKVQTGGKKEYNRYKRIILYRLLTMFMYNTSKTRLNLKIHIVPLTRIFFKKSFTYSTLSEERLDILRQTINHRYYQVVTFFLRLVQRSSTNELEIRYRCITQSTFSIHCKELSSNTNVLSL